MSRPPQGGLSHIWRGVHMVSTTTQASTPLRLDLMVAAHPSTQRILTNPAHTKPPDRPRGGSKALALQVP